MAGILERGAGGDGVIDEYLSQLRRDLGERGVRGAAADRVLAEVRDHLLESHDVERFGPSERIAREIAVQLATTRTIRSTYGAFLALAVTAFGYLALIVYADDRAPNDVLAGKHAVVGLVATLGLLLFPQVAFVSGGLALLRAVRRRGCDALSCEELDVLGRRAAVALAAGGLTAVSMLVWGYEFGYLASAALFGVVAAAPPCLAVPSLAAASSPQAPSVGHAEDVFDDLRLQRLRLRPWFFAGGVAIAAALVALVVDGFVIAGLEFGAILLCFAWLGRPLALRN